MKINREYERVIDLRDLFFHLLYRWRSILVAALIGAILLGTYQFYTLKQTHEAGKLTKAEKKWEIDLQEFRDSLRNARNNVKTYTNLIKEKNDYLNESVYMQLDAQNEWYAYKRYYIKVDQAVLDALPESVQEDPADRVISAYTATLMSGLDPEEMQALLGTGKREYIDELVSVGGDAASNTITVSVIGDTQENVVRQLDYFDNRLNTVSAAKAQAVEAHTLTLMDEDVRSRIDGGLSAKQDEINKQILDWQEALKEQREILNDLEDKEEPKKPVGIKKFAAIGFIVGAFLLAAIYAVKYIMSGVLHSGSELSERYGLPVYGEFAKSRARRPGKGLDKLFEKWEFKHASSEDTVVEEIVAMLRERHNGKCVLLTGTVSGDKLNNLSQKLQSKLEGAVGLATEGDFLTNNAAIADASEADAVVMVEEKHASRLNSIEREAELLIMGSANVSGCIAI